MYTRWLPCPNLKPWLQLLWASDDDDHAVASSSVREHVLPTGHMHLVFRLSERPLRLFHAPNDHDGQVTSCAVVGGARSRYYIRSVDSGSFGSVGAMLRPGAAEALFGVPASELAERHTALSLLWGTNAERIAERLRDTHCVRTRLSILESELLHRLQGGTSLNPLIPYAFNRLAEGVSVDEIVRGSGYSHRHFTALFRTAAGLTPKVYARLQRFQAAVDLFAVADQAGWSEIAVAAGYSDQSHLHRDFVQFAGITPGAYGNLAPANRNHVAVPTQHD